MRESYLRNTIQTGLAALFVAGLLSIGNLASAGTNKSTPAPAPSPAAPAPRPSSPPAARPSGGSGRRLAWTDHRRGGHARTNHRRSHHAWTNHHWRCGYAWADHHWRNASRNYGSGVGLWPGERYGVNNKQFASRRGQCTPVGDSDRSRAQGKQRARHQSGSAVRTRPNGRVSDVHDARRGMDVHHGLNGEPQGLGGAP